MTTTPAFSEAPALIAKCLVDERKDYENNVNEPRSDGNQQLSFP